MVPLPDYPDVFQTAFAIAWYGGETSPARSSRSTPMESRLMQADRIIVGGLIEGVWPPRRASIPGQPADAA